MEKQNKKAVGKAYEDLATAYLIEKGYKILERNYRCRVGEIDIIAKEQEIVVFIEVKYRKTTAFGSPAEAVNYYKRQRILRIAKWYLHAHYNIEINCRFDVIEILDKKLSHIEAAF
ncbi:YraN family protein [Cellulosilyticum ruminicola]|uniref:YraN family protein n=1 Tax=Cellulosilyticum ruminicola TaxID=425254 RepID=UPI001FA73DC5|nr:YraN family protein [Cellulosilyticum ruminicola]